MDKKISKSQLAVTLLLSSIFFVCTISTTALNENLWDSIISVIIAFTVNFLMSLPLLKLAESDKNISELIRENRNIRLLLVIYLVYFLINNALVLLQTETLYSNTIHQNDEAILLVALVLLVSIYGCIKGIESVCRAGLIIFVISVLGILLMYLGLVDFFNMNNREVFFYNGFSDTMSNFIVIFTRSSTLPQLAILLAFVKKDTKITANYAIFNAISTFILASAFFMVVCTMGRFTLVQSYPMYSVFSFAKIEPFEGVDALFSLTWLTILSVKISLDLIAMKNILFCIGIKKHEKTYVIVTAGMIFALFFVFSNITEYINLIEILVLFLIIITGFIIPFCLWLRRGKFDKN